MIKFNHPEGLASLSTDDMASYIADAEAERSEKNVRVERIAVRLSEDTISDIHSIANALGMRSPTTDRIMLPDVLQVALAVTAHVLNTD